MKFVCQDCAGDTLVTVWHRLGEECADCGKIVRDGFLVDND